MLREQKSVMRYYFNLLCVLAVGVGLFGCSDENSNRIDIESAIVLPFPAELGANAFRNYDTYVDRLKPHGKLSEDTAAVSQDFELLPRLENGETLWLPDPAKISAINTFFNNSPSGSLQIFWCYVLPGEESNEKYDPNDPETMRCAENEVALGTTTTTYEYDTENNSGKVDPPSFDALDTNENQVDDIGEFNSGIPNPSKPLAIDGDLDADNLIIVPPVKALVSTCPDMNELNSFESNQWGVSQALLLPQSAETDGATEAPPRNWSILYVPESGNVCVGLPIPATPAGSDLPAVTVQPFPDQEGPYELTENNPVTLPGSRPASLKLTQGDESITMNLVYRTLSDME